MFSNCVTGKTNILRYVEHLSGKIRSSLRSVFKTSSAFTAFGDGLVRHFLQAT